MSKHTILCVNDEENILSALKRVFLGEDDYEIITANGGEEGLAILRKNPIDLIITDLYMPGIDGWKLCRLLRSPEFSEYNNIPILVMSGTFSGSDAEEITRDLGANGFISVPYSSKDLLCAVEKLLSGKILSRTVKVLIVEDDESLRRTICECFKEYGYSIFEASDVNQAFNLFKKVNPEIIILDYHLPNHTGDILLKRLKSLQSQAAVLVITGDSSPDLAIKVTKIGADGYIRKPFKPQYLIDLCEKIRREWSLLRVEKLLEDRTLEFQHIFENSVDGIMTFDASGCIVQVNNAVEKMLGCGREKLAGKYIWELMPQDAEKNKKTMKLMRDLKKQDKISGVEQLWKRTDGSLFYVELNFSAVRDVRSNLTGAVASIREITERKRSEEEVREARDYLTNAIENSLDAIIFSDNKGCISIANQSFLRMIGGRKQEILGKHMAEFSPMEEGTYESTMGELVQLGKEYLDGVSIFVSRLVEVGKITNYENYLIRNDRKIVPVEENIALLYNDKRERIGAIGVIRDITERKMIEKEIKNSRDFLKSVIEGSRDGIVITDEKGNITYTNNSLTEMTKFSREDLIGQHVSFLTIEDKDLKKEILERTGELFEKGFALYESKHKVTGGGSIEVECNCSIIKNDEGNFTAGVSIIRNISERKIIENALMQSEEKYQNLIENANDAVLSINKEGIIVTVNKKAEEMYGYDRGELLGKSVLLLVTPDHREQQKKSLEKFKTLEKIGNFRRTMETSGFRKDGKEIPVETSMFGSEIHGEYLITSFVRDITDRKKMEQQLLQSEKLKSLGELSGGVAHDFNNVLAAILGRVQLLKMHINLPPGKQEKRKSVLELKKGLETIERASLDGAETVRRIQEFSRRRTDDKDFAQVDINELLDNALEFTKAKWKNEAESKGITIKIKKELSPITPIEGSPSELREVFTNLINNAIDAMSQGGEIRINSLMDDNNIFVKIEDTGGGIPKTIKDRIFDPFFTSKGVQSTGLGLSVSYGIINRHRGTITADTVEGKGTTFIIKLPVTKIMDEGKVKEEKVIPIKNKQKKARILVIEDEEDVRELLRDILTDAGHKVEVAISGSEGIKMFEKKEFDLVFTDLGMPVMSGWEVAEMIKNINEEIPVALVTGWNIELDKSEMNRRGINLIVHKPFKMEQVLNLVQEGMVLRDKLKSA